MISLYTDEMKRAVRSVTAPDNFSISIAEHSENGLLMYLEVIADEMQFVRLSYEDKIEAVKYLFAIKKALEDQGAVVLLTRKAVE